MQRLEEFLADEQVRNYLNLSNDVNIFSILEIDEYRHSNLLQWLLDPRGSHLHGDLYVKALLYAAYEAMAASGEHNPFLKSWNHRALESTHLNNALVYRELALDSNNRIDLAIYDPDHDILFLVETKLTSRHDASQLKRYERLAKAFTKRVRHLLHVFIHPYIQEAEKAPSPWIALTYDWLQRALEERLHYDLTENHHLNQLLQFYIDWLSERYSFRNEVQYHDAAHHVSSHHHDFLDHVKAAVQPSTQEELSKVIRGDDIQTIYARHTEKFQYLFWYSEWADIGERIKASLPKHTIAFHFTRRALEIHCEAWRSLYIDASADNYWIWISIRDLTASKPQPVVRTFDIRLRHAPDRLSDAANDGLHAIFGDTVRIRQLSKAQINVSIHDAQGSISNIVEKLVPTIKGMIEDVNRLLC